MDFMAGNFMTGDPPTDNALQRSGDRVLVRPLEIGDEAAFIQASQRSRALHRPWVTPPDNPAAFRTLLGRTGPNFASFLALERSGSEPCGAFNLSQIARGTFQSCYLGYQAFAPWAGQGLMAEALELLLEIVFDSLELHRVEANVQPENAASIALIRGRGFRKEGFSPRYLKLGGEWRDHERWALLEEDWRACRQLP